MKALTELNPFVDFLGAFNLDNFRGSRRDILWSCWRAFEVFTTRCGHISLMILFVWDILEQGTRISSPAIPTVIAGIQTIVASTLLIANNRGIRAAIDHLKLSIGQRKYISISRLQTMFMLFE